MTFRRIALVLLGVAHLAAAPESACVAARQLDDVDSWLAYVVEHPAGECAAEADRRICALASEIAETAIWWRYYAVLPEGHCAPAAREAALLYLMRRAAPNPFDPLSSLRGVPFGDPARPAAFAVFHVTYEGGGFELPEDAFQAVREAEPSLRDCYQRALDRGSRERGGLSFDVRASGSSRPNDVVVAGTSIAPEIGICMRDVLKRVRFPHAEDLRVTADVDHVDLGAIDASACIP